MYCKYCESITKEDDAEGLKRALADDECILIHNGDYYLRMADFDEIVRFLKESGDIKELSGDEVRAEFEE